MDKYIGTEIAVIGIACKFPGANSKDKFWHNLKEGKESISFLDKNEIDNLQIPAELSNNKNYIPCLGGVIDKKEYFDAAFFGYLTKEVEVMDPQLRIFHECVWSALEDSGYDPESYKGQIGLYASASSSSYWEGLTLFSGKSDELGGFASNLLNNSNFLSTRISYKFNLNGPSLFMQTACSSSMVAIHMASRSLLFGECKIAIAGGVSISAQKNIGYLYQDGMILSRDGHCRPFDNNSSGTIGGEGAGVVVLKPLLNAIRDRDNIYAIIKSSSVNNDGNRKVGYTAPSIPGQVEVIQKALHFSKIKPENITYVEAHGTGTPLGDPTEIEALTQAFNTENKNYCAVGSVKANIGHLDAAAGVAGFIKTILSIQNRQIPPLINFDVPNSKIDFVNSPFFINSKLLNWEGSNGTLNAGISSFGIGGTNVHMILEEAPTCISGPSNKQFHLFKLSAHSEKSIEKNSANLSEFIINNQKTNIEDVAYTLNTGRKSLRIRKFVLASNRKELIENLNKNQKPIKVNPDENKQKVVFLFSGIGSQYINMGRDLYYSEKVFKDEVDNCFNILQKKDSFSYKNFMYPEVKNTLLSENRDLILKFEHAQVTTFIFEFALAKLLMSYNVLPFAFIGYSFGEYVAACLAEVFNLEEAFYLINTRSELIKQLPDGALLNIPLPSAEVLPYLIDDVFISIDNGPSCVVSGKLEAIKNFENKMKDIKVLCMPIPAEYPIHCSLLKGISEQFRGKISKIKMKVPIIPCISGLTGDWMSHEVITGPGYWSEQLSNVLNFSKGINKIINENPTVLFIEIGPSRDISNIVRNNLKKDHKVNIINITRHQTENISDSEYFLRAIGKLWTFGIRVDFCKYYANEERARVSLPTYAFDKQKYDWSELLNSEHNSNLFTKKQNSAYSEKPLKDWFYIPLWKQTLVNSLANEELLKYCYLVIGNQGSLSKILLEGLLHSGHKAIFVEPGDHYTHVDAFNYVIDLSNEADYKSLFDSLLRNGFTIDKIIHSLNIAEPGHEIYADTVINQNIERSFFSLLFVARGLRIINSSNNIEIIVLTNNIYNINGNENIEAIQSLSLGLVKTIPQEFSTVRCRNIDISLKQSSIEELAECILNEVTGTLRDTIVSYRNSKRFIKYYEPISLTEKYAGNSKLKIGGCYLIIGGLGNIGLMISELLAKKYKAKLILTSRSEFPDRSDWSNNVNHPKYVTEKISKLKEFEDHGSEILLYKADLANFDEMQNVCMRIENKFGKLDGVIHCAGALKDGQNYGAIDEITKQNCEEQFYAKVQGTNVLIDLLKDKNLDFVWLMSSLSSVLGGLGFASYSAANIYEDCIAEKYRNKNWLSVAWQNIQKEDTQAAFDRILALRDNNQVVVSKGGNLEEKIKKWIDLEPINFEPSEINKNTHRETARTNPYLPPNNQMEAIVIQIWQDYLGIEKIGIEDNLFDLGATSLSIVHVNRKIVSALERDIPVITMFTYPTIKLLVEHLMANEHEITNVILENKPNEFLSRTSNLLLKK